MTVEEYDVIVTAYDTMMSHYSSDETPLYAVPRRGTLFSVLWRWIVLDEGHIIRNGCIKKAVAAIIAVLEAILAKVATAKHSRP